MDPPEVGPVKLDTLPPILMEPEVVKFEYLLALLHVRYSVADTVDVLFPASVDCEVERLNPHAIYYHIQISPTAAPVEGGVAPVKIFLFGAE